jgi:hypothetical protein
VLDVALCRQTLCAICCSQKAIDMKHRRCSAELKLTAIFFVLAIFLSGCSSSYSVRSTAVQGAYTYGEMNEELEGRDVKIELKDGRDISAKEVKISDDSASWVDQRTDEKSKASIREINKIAMKSSLIGALEGLGFGLFGGGGVGALLRAPRELGVAGIPEWVVGMGYGMTADGGIGLITGLIIGHSYNYEFPTTEQSDSLRNGKSR